MIVVSSPGMVSAEMVENWSCSIDEAEPFGNLLRIRGWLFDKTGSDRISRLCFRFGASDDLYDIEHSIPSSDVAQALGDVAASCRLAGDIPLATSRTLRSLADAVLVCETVQGNRFEKRISETGCAGIPDADRALSSLRIGIGITTYNRKEMLAETIQAVKQNSRLPVQIVVCDDGSSDGTAAMLSNINGITTIAARNRGIAWNKNRALFYLSQVASCDVVILIEDDVQPVRDGWDIDWVLAGLLYGHMNYSPPWLRGEKGIARWHAPLEIGLVSGQCSVFSKEALTFVGFLDSRFGRYGHEHVEHTMRMIRAGYGGRHLAPNTRDSTFFMIQGGLHVADAVSSGATSSVKENGLVFDAIWNESIHRWPWRSDEDMLNFRAEMKSAMVT